MGMDEYKVYTYVYGELDDNDNIVYVGKSNDPIHRNKTKRGVKRFRILDKFIDIEQQWIYRLSSSGVKLRNREVIKTCGDFKVGETYNVYKNMGYGSRKKVRHIPTQMVFESKSAASKYFGISRSDLDKHLKCSVKYKWEFV